MAEKLIPLEDAQSIVLSHVVPTDFIEIPVWQAAGLPLTEDAVADIDISPFANSAMDGYAVRAADLAAAAGDTPVTLSVVGHEAAGHVFEGAIAPGETVRIMTGAPVPEGADAVVKYEIVEVLDGDGNEGSHVSFSTPAKVGENVRSAAEEAHAGDVVMRAGEVVAPAGAGLLASAGYASVKVHAAPRVGIISLGTELVAPSELPARGQIRDSNSSALMAEALDAGAEPVFYGIAPDDEQVIAELVHRAVQECDFVITSGGASAGDYDYVTALVRREGEVLFDRISMRPGKAITFGLLGGKPYLGLSGNPAAAPGKRFPGKIPQPQARMIFSGTARPRPCSRETRLAAKFALKKQMSDVPFVPLPFTGDIGRIQARPSVQNISLAGITKVWLQ